MSPDQIRTPLDSTDAWQLVEDKFEVDANLVRETIFSLGNGYLGLRGAHEERFAGFGSKTNDHTFINGFYEASPIHYAETAYGMAQQHQFMLNVPNGKCLSFSADGENFDLFQGEILNFERSLDFRTGILTRKVEWRSPLGKHFEVKSRRLVSFTRQNLFALAYEIKSVNFNGVLTLRSAIDGRVKDTESDEPRYGPAVGAVEGINLQILGVEQVEDFSALVHRTKMSELMLVSALQNDVVCNNSKYLGKERVALDERVEQIFKIEVNAGDTISLNKYVCYFTSRDYPEKDLMDRAKALLAEAKNLGFVGLEAEQREYITEFWRRGDIQIEGNPRVQQGVRFNQFHLLQSVGRDGRTSVAAKGLTGEGYGGHYFWDAEIYALPFFLYSKPEVARKMLEYRYTCLGKARFRAREMSHPRGALFAWRTIAGEECSAFFLAGTAQYHINADIAYAVKLYYEATKDDDFITKYGAEIVLDTARIWMDLGHYEPRKENKFCINAVTGPDEYTVLTDNNFYTNAMARMHLNFACKLAAQLKNTQPDEYERISQRITLKDEEISQWQTAAENMYLPFDEELQIHPQDDTFLSKKVWDLPNTPKEMFPLPLHHHYLVIYRYQVCKQADTVLAMFLLGNQFPAVTKKRDYDYYETITTHDSSLSHCTFSVMASEIGYTQQAYDYFMQSVRMDLDDIHGSASFGVHIAAMGGTWMAIINGFARMRAYDGVLQFDPYVPDQWQSYKFNFTFQSQLVEVNVEPHRVTYTLIEGEGLEFNHAGTAVKLTSKNPSKGFDTGAPAITKTTLLMAEKKLEKVDV